MEEFEINKLFLALIFYATTTMAVSQINSKTSISLTYHYRGGNKLISAVLVSAEKSQFYFGHTFFYR
jgi:hypothetical protein